MNDEAPALTPSQTVGPFFEDCLLRRPANVLAGPSTAGERIRVEGRLLDGDGEAVPDGMVEIWQANAHGRYHHPADRRDDPPLDPGFLGFGRSGTDADGWFSFETVRPGPVPLEPGGTRLQAPHISVLVCSRGLLHHLWTRLYFEDEPANDGDSVLGAVPADRRGTLLARRADRDGATVFRFDIVLQGAGETVFFRW